MTGLVPIGTIRTAAEKVPRHWSVSDLEGEIAIHPRFRPGLAGITAGQRLVVLFLFDRSPAFTDGDLLQTPPHRAAATGVFNTCSPRRPNPIGLSVLTVLAVEEGRLRVRGIDMLDNTPVIDIKPHVEAGPVEG